jgi:hypothetical protein
MPVFLPHANEMSAGAGDMRKKGITIRTPS